MTRRCFPTSAPDWFKLITKLIAPSLAILTVLFLVLPGVSGPQTGFYWLKVEYGGAGMDTDQDRGAGMIGHRDISSSGEIWELGCLGSCKVGEICQQGQELPPHYKPIRDVLRFHLFVTAAFSLISGLSFVLFKFPQSSQTKRYGTLLPIAGPFLTGILFITDIGIAHALEGKKGVKKVDRLGGEVFWLGTVAFVSSTLWLIFAELDGMYRRHKDGEFDEPGEPKEGEAEKGIMERGVAGIGSLWPWKGQTKERREEERGRSTERSRRSSRGGHKRSKSKSKSKSRSSRKRERS